jgi:hypothetical protein
VFVLHKEKENNSFSIRCQKYLQLGKYFNVFQIYFLVHEDNTILEKFIPLTSAKETIEIFYEKLD